MSERNGSVRLAARRIPVRRSLVVELLRSGERVEVFVRIRGGWHPRSRVRSIDGGGRLASVRTRGAREAVNDLLRRLDRPEI
jgi:hypothetical protein